MGRGLRQLGFLNVTPMRDRHGKVRYRFRKKGLPTVYLPGLPGSPEFAEAYQAAAAGAQAIVPGQGRTQPGSINALAVAAYASAEWSNLAETTRANYRGVMERFRRDHGDKTVRALTSANLLSLRDKMEGNAARNNFIKALRWFLAFAVSRGLRTDNPAMAIKKIAYRTDGYHTWTEAEVAAFEARWPVGTKQRLGMDLLLYTGQRSKDVRMMGRQHLSAAGVSVRQSKTGAWLTIPIHPRLAASLATVPADQMQLLLTQYGEGYTAGGFGNWIKEACRQAGVPECSAHGLRKCIAVRLADAGCTILEIQSITGHASLKELEIYIRRRDQTLAAKAAMARIDTDGERDLANPVARLANGASNSMKG